MSYDSRMQVAERTYTPASASVSSARHFVTDTLGGWSADGLAWSAQQVVSELATNAVLHAATPFTVVLSLDGNLLRIVVRDDSSRVPRPRNYSQDATTGRGLALVAMLAVAWGVQQDGSGKSIWCELIGNEGELDGPIDLDAFLGDDDLLDLAGPEGPGDPTPSAMAGLRRVA